MAKCQCCNSDSIAVACLDADGCFSIMTCSCLDWMILIPKNLKTFTYTQLCHTCIESMVFKENTLLVHRDYFNNDYEFTRHYDLSILSPKARVQYQLLINNDFVHFMKSGKIIDTNDQKIIAGIKALEQVIGFMKQTCPL